MRVTLIHDKVGLTVTVGKKADGENKMETKISVMNIKMREI